jgi:hypothetical protein
MAGPPVLYYLAIDGTEAQDSAVFGALLEGRGWKNLAATYLKPAADDPTRLVDPAHDFLPIPVVEARGKRVAVVSPGGRDSKGLDRFWRSYPGEAKDQIGRVVHRRYAAAELSAAFMRQLILRPAIHTHELVVGHLSRHLADAGLPYASKHAPSARVLYISSHGFQSGVMFGESISPDRTDPPDLRHSYSTDRYFRPGVAAAEGEGFHGPEWIVLAQCSTLNASSWQMWARLLSRSSPGVRGILGYEEGSPVAKAAVPVAERFFQHLDEGVPFLDAWSRANADRQWAALVHREARKDTLTNVALWQPLSNVEFSSDKANYHGHRRLMGADGEPVYDTNVPFLFKLEHEVDEGSFEEVNPESRHRRASAFDGRHLYRLTVGAPEGSVLQEVSVTVVYLRDTFRDRQFTWNELFTLPDQGTLKVEGFNTATVKLHPPATTDLSKVAFQVRARPGELGLDLTHSYLWFRVAIRTDAGRLQYDFKSQGLYY